MGFTVVMIANLFVHSTHVNSGGSETTSVDVRCSGDSSAGPRGCVPPSWLLSTMCSPHSIAVKLCAVSVKRFLIQSRFVFYAGQYVVQLLSFLKEGQHWSGSVERPHDCEHVQAIRLYFGRERLPSFFLSNRGKSGVRARRWMPSSRIFDQGGHDVIATMLGV